MTVGGTTSLAGMRVLIVEDHIDSATGLGRLLRLFGCEVAIVANGRDALRTATQFAPHAALIDLTLPGLDGFDVARQLRALTATRNCHLIAMTGWTAEDYIDRARAAGFDAHLEKPIPSETLIHALSPIGATSGTSWPSDHPDSIELR